MNIYFVVDAYKDRVTGPRNSVTKLAASLVNQKNYNARVFSYVIEENFSYNGFLIEVVSKNVLKDADFVIFSGVWHMDNIRLSRFLSDYGIPYAVSPRSSLMWSSLRSSFLKKFTFYLLFGRRYLSKASFIHFLTNDEKCNSFQSKKGVVVSNIVQPVNLTANPKLKKEKLITFIGRLDIKHKGLDLLIAAIGKLQECLREGGWRVEIRGPDMKEGNDRAVMFELIAKLGVADLINIGEAIEGDDKSNILEQTSIFVHTSRYEGQPQAVMEAMSHYCACLVTFNTNMHSAMSASGAGIAVKSNTNSVFLGLKKILNSNLTEMQCAAHKFAIANYSDKVVAENFAKEISKRL